MKIFIVMALMICKTSTGRILYRQVLLDRRTKERIKESLLQALLLPTGAPKTQILQARSVQGGAILEV